MADSTHGTAYALGALIGRRARGEDFDRIADETMRTSAAGPRSNKKKIAPARCLLARGPRGLETGSAAHQTGESRILAQNVAGETRGGLAKVSIEQVCGETIMSSSTHRPGLCAMCRNDPAWGRRSRR